MKVKKVPLQQAVGHTLLHNQADSNGRRMLRKGQQLTPDNIATLQELGRTEVYIAEQEADDIAEDEAARRLAAVLQGNGISAGSARTGRVDLAAERPGLFTINLKRLADFNECDGITLGTRPTYSVVQAGDPLATLKIIPYAVPRQTVAQAETIAAAGILSLHPFKLKQATLITTGSAAARKKVTGSFSPALRERLARYHTTLTDGPYVPENEADIGRALQAALAQGAELILIGGETSIMDENDITPRAIKNIGGQVVLHGVPVEPGNLLLLAYHQNVPIVGAPGCARSKSYNVVDMVLPRLVAGQRLTRRDLTALGHGGLLK